MHYFYYFFCWWVWTTANSCFALTSSPNTNSGDCRLGQWTATLFLFFHSFPFSFWDYQQLLLCRGFYWRVPQQQHHHTFFCCCRHLLFSWQTKHRVSSNTVSPSLQQPPIFLRILKFDPSSLSFSPISSSSSTSLAYHQVFWVLDIWFCFLVVSAQIWGQNFEIFLFLFVLSNQRFSRLTELDDSSFHDELVHERAKI